MPTTLFYGNHGLLQCLDAPGNVVPTMLGAAEFGRDQGHSTYSFSH